MYWKSEAKTMQDQISSLSSLLARSPLPCHPKTAILEAYLMLATAKYH